MATLRLMRPDDKTNQMAEMVVYLNGEQLGILRNNETKAIEVPPGEHRLKARVESQESKVFKFPLTIGERKSLVVTTYNKESSPEPLISGTLLDFIVAPLQMLYYFIIGNNQYVAISELKMK